MIEIAIVGAGMAGLTCAQQLHQAGYDVVVFDKSRGVGGRMATRRAQGTWADHGLRYFEDSPEGDLTALLSLLRDRGLIHPWTDHVQELGPDGQLRPSRDRHPRYVAALGINSVAKFLATGLTLHREHRVSAIAPTPAGQWHLTFAPPTPDVQAPDPVLAKILVLAIPAAQALDLLAPVPQIPGESLAALEAVTFDPCMTVMAGYRPHPTLENLDWQAIALPQDPLLSWISLESSKRSLPAAPVLVLHSSPSFAAENFDAPNLTEAAHALLQRAASVLQISYWQQPDWLQVHRWRYAIPQQSHHDRALAATQPAPWICGGDWCGGEGLSSAYRSGFAMAHQVNQWLEGRPLKGEQAWMDLVSEKL
ncbi:amine oxidase [Geitlerinema sp. PCC 7407]|nr:amine oxidase [Geitlerinema sp. PCC 7407]